MVAYGMYIAQPSTNVPYIQSKPNTNASLDKIDMVSNLSVGSLKIRQRFLKLISIVNGLT